MGGRDGEGHRQMERTCWAGWVQSVCWSPDSKPVVSGSCRDGMARIWSVKSGKLVLGPLNGIKTGRTQRKWNQNLGCQHREAALRNRTRLASLVFGLDVGKKLISGTGYGSIRIFDIVTSQQISILEGHTYIVYSITLFHNDRLLSSTSFDGTVRLWNFETKLPVCPLLTYIHAFPMSLLLLLAMYCTAPSPLGHRSSIDPYVLASRLFSPQRCFINSR
ncbi:WD40 repeat-like protein [Suillus decipiens]|nr:WD40 repeat-like protein [Suillus decipiens]